jgi:hypothetical protein
MEGVTFIAGLALGGFIAYLATFVTIESGWKDDCVKIGYHVTASNGAVFKCEPRK